MAGVAMVKMPVAILCGVRSASLRAFLFQIQHVAAERRRSKGCIDSKVREVVAAHVIEPAYDRFTGRSGGLEQILDAAILEHDPRVKSRLSLLPSTPPTDIKLRGKSKFRQLSPRPESMIFAVTLAQLLERLGMLPIVGLEKEIGVAYIVAASEPIAQCVHGLDPDMRLALEIPPEIVA